MISEIAFCFYPMSLLWWVCLFFPNSHVTFTRHFYVCVRITLVHGHFIWRLLPDTSCDHTHWLITKLHVAEIVRSLNTLIRNITLTTESWTKNVWTITHLAEWNSGKMCCLLSLVVVWVHIDVNCQVKWRAFVTAGTCCCLNIVAATGRMTDFQENLRGFTGT